jgi:hypothetical protein
MKKLLLMMSMLLAVANFAYAEENYYCPSPIYCSTDQKAKRVRCTAERTEPEVWLEADGANIGTLNLSYVEFKKPYQGSPDGHRCVYIQGVYGTIVTPKVIYNLAPDMKKESRWLNTTKNRADKDNLICGSYTSPIASSKDCPFKIDASLLLVSDTEIYPVLAHINNTAWVTARCLGKVYYPDKTNFSFTDKIEFKDLNKACGNEKICKIDIQFKYKNKLYTNGSVWLNTNNNMEIFDISQPRDASFKMIRIGFNSIAIKTS